MDFLDNTAEKQRIPLYGLILLVAVILGYSVWLRGINNDFSSSITLDSTAITITCENQENVTIALDDITDVQLIGSPAYQARDFGTLNSGLQETALCYGSFTTEEDGEYFACANPKLNYYIEVYTADRMYLLNKDTDKNTTDFYQEIMEAIDK